MNDYVLITLGMLCAAAGGELLMRGALGMAAWLRIPPLVTRGIVALFIFAAAEIAVVLEAARIGHPDLALGAALGTGIVQLGLVLSIACLSTPAEVRRARGRRIVAVAAAAPLVTLVFCRDSFVTRTEGALLWGLFGLWIVTSLWDATRAAAEKPDEAVAEGRGWLAIAFCFVGLLLLASTGRVIVHGIEGLAQAFDRGFFKLGVLLAPLAITVPELTSMFAIKFRTAGGVSTQRLLANCILSAWFLAGLAAVMAPFRVPFTDVLPAAIAASLLALTAWPTAYVPVRARGAILAAIYIGFLCYQL